MYKQLTINNLTKSSVNKYSYLLCKNLKVKLKEQSLSTYFPVGTKKCEPPGKPFAQTPWEKHRRQYA